MADRDAALILAERIKALAADVALLDESASSRVIARRAITKLNEAAAVLEDHTGTCARCGQPFISQRTSAKFCSKLCTDYAAQGK